MDDDFVNIDSDRLDREWIGQPKLALQVGESEAEAVYALDQAKNQLEFIEAELSLDVRLTPSEYGLPDKPTEATIKAAVMTNKKYQDAVDLVHKFKHTAKLYAVRVTAVEHRKRALEKLVDLFMRGYDSNPKTTTEARESMQERQQKAARTSIPVKPKTKIKKKATKKSQWPRKRIETVPF